MIACWYRRLVSLDDLCCRPTGQNSFQVAGGYRMPQCEFCPDVMYQLLMSCWATDQEQRPSAQLVAAKMPEIMLDTRMNKVVPPPPAPLLRLPFFLGGVFFGRSLQSPAIFTFTFSRFPPALLQFVAAHF